jgi:hypothetical protein
MAAGSIILQTPFVVLRYHPVERIVHHEFLQRVAGEEFRRALIAGLEVLKKNKAEKWLSDDRKHTVLPADDEAWATKVWFPQVVKAGWKYWAIVNPEKAVGQMQAKRNIATFSMGGITAATFSEPDAAFSWLTNLQARAA